MYKINGTVKRTFASLNTVTQGKTYTIVKIVKDIPFIKDDYGYSHPIIPTFNDRYEYTPPKIILRRWYAYYKY